MVERRARRDERTRGATSVVAAVALCLLLAITPAESSASQRESAPIRWRWPLQSAVVVEPFAAPATRYGPGHRGVDLAGALGAPVRAPADGVVAFAGSVVDRGVLTLDHGGGYVSTLEPIDTELTAGSRVAQGDVVGRVSTGGHSAHGQLHVGVRLDGEYINPVALIGDVPRAILLPCC